MIDLGSNSAKMVSYRLGQDGSFERYRHESFITKLGEDLSQTGFLSEAATTRAVISLKRFREIVDAQSIHNVLPIATSAVREAADRKKFLKKVRRETRFRFRVLSGREEALYSYFGAACSLKIPSALFFDLGGGSLEIVHAHNFTIREVMSLPLGALQLTQMYANENDGSFSDGGMERLRERILSLIPDRDELGLASEAVMVGVGGTLRNMARIDQMNNGYPLSKLHNYVMSRTSVSRISSMLRAMRPASIAKIERISAGRAESITAGSCVIDLLMARLGFGSVTVSTYALREGALGISLRFPHKYAYGAEITAEAIGRAVRAASGPNLAPDASAV